MRVLAHPCRLQMLYIDIEFVKFLPPRDRNYVPVRSSLLPVELERVEMEVRYVNNSKTIHLEVEEGCQENMKDVALCPECSESVWTITVLR